MLYFNLLKITNVDENRLCVDFNSDNNNILKFQYTLDNSTTIYDFTNKPYIINNLINIITHLYEKIVNFKDNEKNFNLRNSL